VKGGRGSGAVGGGVGWGGVVVRRQARCAWEGRNGAGDGSREEKWWQNHEVAEKRKSCPNQN